MKYIGGFFELEIPQGAGPLHRDAIELNTGRACLSLIFQAQKPKRLHLPFYMCNAVLEAVAAAGVTVVFYGLDSKLELLTRPALSDGDMLLVVNYFGLQSSYTGRIAREFGHRCIIDNTQAFFESPAPECFTIYSARKFLGVADGAYLYAPRHLAIEPFPLRRNAPDVRHLVNRLAGRQQTAYRQCRAYEAEMTSSVRKMSLLSERLLSTYDYKQISLQRRQNYLALHQHFVDRNEFEIHLEATATPMCYPLLLPELIDRTSLAKRGLYIPTLWQDVIERQGFGFELDRSLASRLLPLPIDQRYGIADMHDLISRFG
jgi:hypothetical protein